MTNRQHSVLQNIELGIGTWAWGDQVFWGYGKGYGELDVKAAFEASIQAGVKLFDTAEIYGNGKSEALLGNFLAEIEEKPVIATKFMPFPWRLSRKLLLRSLEKSLQRLQMKQIDLYQMHWTFPPVSIESWMESMVEAVNKGWTKAVGVSNYNLAQTMRAAEALQKQGIALASNQVEYNLLNRRIEKNGLLEACKQAGITIIAYSPLAQGLLTGKYTPENPPQGIRSRRSSRAYLADIQPLVALLKQIGADHGDKTPAQVALNWTICKGTLTIPGAKTAKQAASNLGAQGWKLTDSEVEALDEASDRVQK